MVRKTSKYKRVTLVDVGRAAEVSPITVSRCLRDPGKVSKPARDRIMAAVDKLGYVPDPAASALASDRTNVIGMIVPSLTNAVFSDVIKGVYDAIENTRFSVQIANSRYNPDKEDTLIRTFLRQKPAGLIVSGIDQTETGRALLQEAPCPVVQIMDVDSDPIDMQIGFSHLAAAKMAVSHLFDCGYKRPGLLAARMDPRSQARVEGFRQVSAEHGALDEARILTTPAPSSVGLGGQMLADLLARSPDTDAVFCVNDDLAAGALFEAQRRNLSVPDAFGISGFNDLEISAFVNPSLTSVATPRYEIGQSAIEMINRDLKEDIKALPRQIRLSPELRIRNSTRKM